MEYKDLIEKLGFDLKEVEKAAKPDELIESFHKKSQDEYFDIFKNELGAKDLTQENIKDFIKEVKDKTFGQYIDGVERAIRKINPELTEDVLKELKMPEKIGKLAESLKSKYSSSKDVEELQTKLIGKENEMVTLKEATTAEIKKAKEEAQGQLVKDKVDWGMKNKFLTIPKEKLLNGKHNDGFYTAVSSVIGNKFDLGLDEKGDIVPFQKGSTIRATDKKDGKEYFVGIDELMMKTLDELGFIQKSNGQGQQSQKQEEQKFEPKNNGTDHSEVAARAAWMRERIGVTE